MKKTIFIIMLLIVSSTTYSQSVSCNKLYQTIKSELTASTTYCYGSDWIQKVEFYYYEGSYFAVAYIKANEYSYQYKPYLYCGISSWEKTSFSYNSGSYGEAFWENIEPNKCNCY